MENKEIDIKTLAMALNLCGVSVNIPTTDLIKQVIDKIVEKGDEFSVKDAAVLLANIQRKYPADEQQK